MERIAEATNWRNASMLLSGVDSNSLIVVSRSGEIVYANPLFYEFYGSENIASLHEVVPREEQPIFAANLILGQCGSYFLTTYNIATYKEIKLFVQVIAFPGELRLAIGRPVKIEDEAIYQEIQSKRR